MRGLTVAFPQPLAKILKEAREVRAQKTTEGRFQKEHLNLGCIFESHVKSCRLHPRSIPAEPLWVGYYCNVFSFLGDFNMHPE